jgi:hypothetical protein
VPEKAKKKARVEEKTKKPQLNKKLLAFSTILTIIIILGTVLYQLFWRTSENKVKFSLKAAIVDQLSEYESTRNQSFVSEITKILEDRSFNVSYYNHTKVDVDFFKKLAKGDYGIIILRVHAALRKGGSAVDFFTSQPYNPNLYTEEQKRGLLVKGELNVSGIVKSYFAFTPEFVRNLEGVFPESVVIAMGCQSLNRTVEQQMATAFCDKGAKVYVGWTSWVSSQHSDSEIIKFMRCLLYKNNTVETAVKNAFPDREWGTPSYLDFYPPSAANLTINSLIKETKTSSLQVEPAMLRFFYNFVGVGPIKRFNSLATIIYS